MLEVKAKNDNLNPKANLKYRTYIFALEIVKLVKLFPTNKIYQIFTDQLLRSATSIGANIIEGKASSSKKDFIKFYQISLKSANETLFWLCLLRDSKLVDQDIAKTLIAETEEISRMLGASLLTLKNKRAN